MAEGRGQSARVWQPRHGLQLHLASRLPELSSGVALTLGACHSTFNLTLARSPHQSLWPCTTTASMPRISSMFYCRFCAFGWRSSAFESCDHFVQVHELSNLPIVLTEWAAQVARSPRSHVPPARFSIAPLIYCCPHALTAATLQTHAQSEADPTK